MTTPTRTFTELQHLANRVAVLAAEADAVADAVDRARATPLRATREVTLAVDLLRTLSDALDRDLHRNLRLDPTVSRGLDRARSLSRGLDHSLGRAVTRARSLERVLDLDDELEDEFDDVEDELDELGRVRDLARVVVRLVSFFVRSAALKARFLVRGLALSGPLEDAHFSAWGVRDAVSTMEARVWALLLEAQGRQAGGEPMAVPTRAAQTVLELALNVLPISARPRYREEFLGELHALAQSQASRRAQLGYALVVAWRAWPLQRTLCAAAPTEERVR